MLCCPTSGESFTTKSSHTSDFQTCKTYYSCLKYLILDNACDIIQSQPKLNCQSEVRIFEVKNEKYPKFTLCNFCYYRSFNIGITIEARHMLVFCIKHKNAKILVLDKNIMSHCKRLPQRLLSINEIAY